MPRKKPNQTPASQLPPPGAAPQGHGLTPMNPSPAGIAPTQDPGSIGAQPAPPEPEIMSTFQISIIHRLLVEQANRGAESLKLYEPLPVQEEFHKSRCPTELLRGSNRGGKTLPAAVEVARAVTGQDPHGKYPRRDGRCFAVGKDLDHVGQVMYRKLFRSGAFKMIRDEVSHQWRAFRRWDPKDVAREAEAKPAPPLIPKRFIKEIAWENKKENIPSIIRLTTGWELSFYSSLGKPPQGSDLDLGWFDEEIVDPEWYPEMIARMLDRRGRLIWSATPQAGTDQLYELHEQAAEQHGRPDARVREFVILLAENPHIREEDKRIFASALSEEDRRVRIGGDFALLSFKIYPEFSMLVHGMKLEIVPPHWTRYAVIDPGHQVCAVLFGAVPPPIEGNFLLLYDELYLRECSAFKFGEAMATKCQGVGFEAFYIDSHMALHTEVGIGKSVGQQYTDALRERKIASRRTGSSFLYASDDIDAGLLAVKDLLRIRSDSKPRLRVREGFLPNFEYEIKRYHRKRLPGGLVSDKPDARKANHLMDDLRYFALASPRYVAAPAEVVRVAGALKAFRDKQSRRATRDGQEGLNLGPGRSGSWRT